MKKIALFISSLRKGGSERVMLSLAEYLHGQGYDVMLVTQHKSEKEYDLLPGILRIYSEPDKMQLKGGRIRKFLTRFCTLRKIWKEQRPDTVLSFIGKNNMMAIMTAAFMPINVAVSVRAEPTVEYEGKLMQMLAKIIFRFADLAIFQTKQAQKFFPMAIQKKSKILPNPINPQFLNRRYFGEREDVIVTVGRIDENKNHAMLIHAFAKIAGEYPLMRLVIYGEGELRPKLEALAEEKGLSDRISLPGSISDVADRICKARIFTCTSNNEGMPNALIEAMALGLPVISTDCPCGGAAALINDGENGILIPVGDAYALSDAFRRILSDEEYARKLGENAYQITELLAPDKACAEWEESLAQLGHR